MENPHNINGDIKAEEVRLVGDNVEVGVYAVQKALELAREQELDLVEISPNAVPPVCKIIDYRKFLYEQKKREKHRKRKQGKMKQLLIRPGKKLQQLLKRPDKKD